MNAQVVERGVVPRLQAAPKALPSRLVTVQRQQRRQRRSAWQVRWYEYKPEGGIGRRSETFKTRDEAEQFRTAKAAELDADPKARKAPNRITLGQFIAEFIAARTGSRGERLRPTSLALCKQDLERLAGFVGRDIPLADLTSDRADAFVNALYGEPGRTGGKLSRHTVAKIVRTLKACFAVATNRRGYIRVNPFTGHKTGKAPKPAIRYITQAEIRALLAACGADLSRQAFLTLCYTTGLRFGEAVNLVWSNVDFATGTIHVTVKTEAKQTLAWEPKTAESLREIPAPQATMDLLQRLLEAAEPGHAYVFIPRDRFDLVKAAKESGDWKETMKPLNNFPRAFAALVKRAAKVEPSLLDGEGKPSVSIHDFRRTCITHWTEALPMQAVSKLAGHSNIQTTANYYASTTDQQRELARSAAQAAVENAVESRTDTKLTPKAGVRESDSHTTRDSGLESGMAPVAQVDRASDF